MPIQGLNFTILASSEAHQSYQSTGSFIVYNPNDGVAFVATDRTATGLSWDYKVPSQSGGKFPGPINSYLSIYYLDQSGGGAPGQIVVYASPEVVNIPYFWSIGRATQLQSTSLDIVGGPQPGNPGAGIGRLWIDTGGHLNVLQPSGANYLELDSANYNSVIALGGDLYGTLNVAHVGLQNGSYIGGRDTGGNMRRLMSLQNDNNNYLFTGSGGILYFYNDGVVGAAGPLGQWNAGNGVLSVQSGYMFTTIAVAAPTLYLAASNTGPYIQAAGTQSIRYDIVAGGVHSFESQAGGYGPVNTGNLTVTGSEIVTALLTANGGLSVAGPLALPANSIQRVFLQQQSGSRYLGSFQGSGSFSTTTLNTWIGTPVSFGFNIGAGESGIVVLSATCSVVSNVVGTTIYVALAIDGNIGLYKECHEPAANYPYSMDITEVFSGIAAGSHNATIYMQANAGTWGYNGACHQFLVATETVF